jgi:hypothetical protein
MKVSKSWMRRLLLSASLVGAAAGGGTLLVDSPVEAAMGPITNLCGWTTVWDCTLPDGDHVTLVGTQCDVAAFRRSTGATCVVAAP